MYNQLLTHFVPAVESYQVCQPDVSEYRYGRYESCVVLSIQELRQSPRTWLGTE